jgi:hypothetical protein
MTVLISTDLPLLPAPVKINSACSEVSPVRQCELAGG